MYYMYNILEQKKIKDLEDKIVFLESRINTLEKKLSRCDLYCTYSSGTTSPSDSESKFLHVIISSEQHKKDKTTV
jgi:hypothetical protein